MGLLTIPSPTDGSFCLSRRSALVLVSQHCGQEKWRYLSAAKDRPVQLRSPRSAEPKSTERRTTPQLASGLACPHSPPRAWASRTASPQPGPVKNSSLGAASKPRHPPVAMAFKLGVASWEQSGHPVRVRGDDSPRRPPASSPAAPPQHG